MILHNPRPPHRKNTKRDVYLRYNVRGKEWNLTFLKGGGPKSSNLAGTAGWQEKHENVRAGKFCRKNTCLTEPLCPQRKRSTDQFLGRRKEKTIVGSSIQTQSQGKLAMGRHDGWCEENRGLIIRGKQRSGKNLLTLQGRRSGSSGFSANRRFKLKEWEELSLIASPR